MQQQHYSNADFPLTLPEHGLPRPGLSATVDIGQRLTAGVVNDEAFAVLLDGPRRRLTCSAMAH